ncbi:AAA family ATPase [Polaromonas sp.]|uniref:AAA family ATPase n=1 Tax=Polaromonas sp. TaxID=1869339 RepID=UPI0024888DFD|nr:AAA family ATPase [Polaromonas sp.]MDI1275567.1 AAA family ATPase [Polaromonas sp.]
MTLLSPTLIVNELAVFKDGRNTLAISFHKGLNILRGQNSSGKTTTLDFIAHTLGAEDIPWKKEALLCDYSIVEVSLNGRRVTLRRDVNDSRQQPMYIFWGALDEAMRAPITAWELYPFRRSQNKLSFTQSLLVALDLPEAQGDGASNLTMHQFLRVMYADQPSLHSPIFRIDSFDNALTRETVGNYLSGVYNDKLYSAQLSKRELEKEISQADSELKSIFTVLAKSKQDINMEFFGQQILEAERRRTFLLAELARMKVERTVERDKKRTSDEGPLRAALDSAKKGLATSLDAIARLEFELQDSRNFVQEIESRLLRLDESETTRSYFGSVAFNFCPCCLAEVKPPSAASEQCALCKSPLHDPSGETQILRMRNELRIQLRESTALINARESELRLLRTSVPSVRQELRSLEGKYLEATQSWSSDLETAIEAASRETGSLDQEIKGLYENQKLAGAIKDLQIRRDALLQKLSELDSLIESLRYAQDGTKRDVALTVANSVSRLLKQDFKRQEEFKSAEHVQFSFIDNQVIVDGSAKFSESSTVFLRHIFHLALLSASTKLPAMRFPRFLMLDGIEDGGMELARAYHLQEIIATECASYEVDYQLIFATSQISPSLNNERFVVGRSFTEDHKSLEILA